MAVEDGPITTLVLGVDAGHFSWDALDSVRAIATSIGADIRLLHATPGVVAETITAQAAEADLPLDVVGAEGGDEVAAAMVEHVRRLDGAVASLTSHARRGVGASLLGSHAAAVLAASAEPVLLFGPHHEDPTPMKRLLACIDGSDVSEAVLGAACRWARAADVPLWLVHVVEPGVSAAGGSADTNYVRRIAEDLGDSGLDIEFDVLHGDHPGRSIAEYANQEPGTLTALATHGRSGLSEIMMGSVAMEVTRRSIGPTLVLRAA